LCFNCNIHSLLTATNTYVLQVKTQDGTGCVTSTYFRKVTNIFFTVSPVKR
jgi:hypothetical protein